MIRSSYADHNKWKDRALSELAIISTYDLYNNAYFWNNITILSWVMKEVPLCRITIKSIKKLCEEIIENVRSTNMNHTEALLRHTVYLAYCIGEL